MCFRESFEERQERVCQSQPESPYTMLHECREQGTGRTASWYQGVAVIFRRRQPFANSWQLEVTIQNVRLHVISYGRRSCWLTRDRMCDEKQHRPHCVRMRTSSLTQRVWSEAAGWVCPPSSWPSYNSCSHAHPTQSSHSHHAGWFGLAATHNTFKADGTWTVFSQVMAISPLPTSQSLCSTDPSC
jgi:hypothetical protein